MTKKKVESLPVQVVPSLVESRIQSQDEEQVSQLGAYLIREKTVQRTDDLAEASDSKVKKDLSVNSEIDYLKPLSSDQKNEVLKANSRAPKRKLSCLEEVETSQVKFQKEEAQIRLSEDFKLAISFATSDKLESIINSSDFSLQVFLECPINSKFLRDFFLGKVNYFSQDSFNRIVKTLVLSSEFKTEYLYEKKYLDNEIIRLSISKNDFELFKFLLGVDPDSNQVNVQRYFGCTLIVYIMQLCDEETISKFLGYIFIENKVSLDTLLISGGFFKRAIFHAIIKRQSSIVKLLLSIDPEAKQLEFQANSKVAMFVEIFKTNDSNFIKDIFEYCVDHLKIDIKTLLIQKDENEETAMHHAVRNQNFTICKLLMSQDPEGILLGTVNRYCMTPLIALCKFRYQAYQSEVIELLESALINSKIRIEALLASGGYYKKPIFYAIERKNFPLLEILLRADPERIQLQFISFEEFESLRETLYCSVNKNYNEEALTILADMLLFRNYSLSTEDFKAIEKLNTFFDQAIQKKHMHMLRALFSIQNFSYLLLKDLIDGMKVYLNSNSEKVFWEDSKAINTLSAFQNDQSEDLFFLDSLELLQEDESESSIEIFESIVLTLLSDIKDEEKKNYLILFFLLSQKTLIKEDIQKIAILINTVQEMILKEESLKEDRLAFIDKFDEVEEIYANTELSEAEKDEWVEVLKKERILERIKENTQKYFNDYPVDKVPFVLIEGVLYFTTPEILEALPYFLFNYLSRFMLEDMKIN